MKKCLIKTRFNFQKYLISDSFLSKWEESLIFFQYVNFLKLRRNFLIPILLFRNGCGEIFGNSIPVWFLRRRRCFLFELSGAGICKLNSFKIRQIFTPFDDRQPYEKIFGHPDVLNLICLLLLIYFQNFLWFDPM